MQIDTLSQINEVINSLVKKGNFKQANNLNQLFLKMAQADAASAPPTGSTSAAPGPTAPTGPTASPTGKPQQGPNTANKQPTVDMMNIIKQFYVLKNWAKENNKFYSFSRGKFYTDDNEGKRVSANTVGELLAPLGVEKVDIQELAGEAQQLATNIIREISSASSWTDASPEASQAINAKYDLGYNFEQSKYYIADPNSQNDAEFRDTVAELKTVYDELGTYYEAKKSLPPNLAARKGTVPKNSEEEEKATKGVDVSGAPTDPGEPRNMTSSSAELNNTLM
jgi:hypothetical protein